MYERIAMLCKERGVTVKDLERNLGFGNGTIQFWKKGSPRVDKLKAVADYFGVTVDALISGEPEKQEKH